MRILIRQRRWNAVARYRVKPRTEGWPLWMGGLRASSERDTILHSACVLMRQTELPRLRHP